MVIGQTANIFFILSYLPLSQNYILLFWSNVIARLFLYLSGAFIVQLALYLYFPKSKKRLYVSYLIVLYGIVMFFLNLTLSCRPFIDSLGILNLNSPLWFGFLFIIPLLFIWVSLSFVFLVEFFKSGFRSIKSLVIGFGFLLGAISGAAQDFAKTTLEYFSINMLLGLGFVLIFIGMFIKDKNSKV